MKEQPTALWLADALETPGKLFARHEVAIELRRLYEENKRMQEQRDELLLECIDIVAIHGGSVEIEAAIRAKMEQPE